MDSNKISKLPKFKKNLSLIKKDDGSEWIKSYDTLVAQINREKGTIKVNDFYSMTTCKHINYVISLFKYRRVCGDCWDN